eukprot:scaffold2489_cov110-Isochrysis_galbana.AAC.13
MVAARSSARTCEHGSRRPTALACYLDPESCYGRRCTCVAHRAAAPQQPPRSLFGTARPLQA